MYESFDEFWLKLGFPQQCKQAAIKAWNAGIKTANEHCSEHEGIDFHADDRYCVEEGE